MYFQQQFNQFKKCFRDIEKLQVKCVSIESSLKFNQTCLNNGLYPLFVQIKLRGRAVTSNAHAEKLQQEELSKEIEKKNSELDE